MKTDIHSYARVGVIKPPPRPEHRTNNKTPVINAKTSALVVQSSKGIRNEKKSAESIVIHDSKATRKIRLAHNNKKQSH